MHYCTVHIFPQSGQFWAAKANCDCDSYLITVFYREICSGNEIKIYEQFM